MWAYLSVGVTMQFNNWIWYSYFYLIIIIPKSSEVQTSTRTNSVFLKIKKCDALRCDVQIHEERNVALMTKSVLDGKHFKNTSLFSPT